MKKSYLVIGAGRFGTSVATALYELGHHVMVVDEDESIIQQISSQVTDAVTADITSEASLKAIGVRDFDAVVLAIGANTQSSIMAAILLTEMEARYIIAKADSELHGKVLQKIGVNQVVYPERDTGHKLAHSLIAPTFIDMIELSDEYSVVEVKAPEDMVGKTLLDVDLRARFGINVIALRRNHGQKTVISPTAEDTIEAEDIIVAIGKNKSLQKIKWI